MRDVLEQIKLYRAQVVANNLYKSATEGAEIETDDYEFLKSNPSLVIREAYKLGEKNGTKA